MRQYHYLNESADFILEDPELTSYLYFPIANENGVMASVTPSLHGDNKMGQNTYLLAPVSVEELHNSKASRNFWCIMEGKNPWSVVGNSSNQQANLYKEEKEKTYLRAGIMWQEVERISAVYGLKAKVLSIVPASGETVELMKVTIENIGVDSVTFTPIAAIPLYARSADNYRDHRHVTSLLHRIHTTDYGVIVNPTLTFDERGHKKNEVIYGVLGTARGANPPVSFYPTVEGFIGEGGSLEQPRAFYSKNLIPMAAGESVAGYEALGGLVFENVTLKGGEEASYTIAMGYGNTEEDFKKEAKKFLLSDKAFDDEVQYTKNYWNQKINIHYRTGNQEFDYFMYWVNFQPMLRRIYGCSFLPHHDYGKGGRGWRDLWQDCLALLMMNPSGVRGMLHDNFSGIRMDGTNATIIGTKQGEFIADRNNITRVWMDHGVWPLLTTNLYINHSGDIRFLLEEITYFKDMQAVRGEEKDTKYDEGLGKRVKTIQGEQYQGTILEHLLLQNLTAFYDVGEHNHIRLRGADWNDALDMAKERGESVAFTAAYALNLMTLAELLEKLEEHGVTSVLLAKEMQILLTEDITCFNDIERKKDILYTYCKQVKESVSGQKVEVFVTNLVRNLKNKSEWIKDHIRNEEWLTNAEGFHWFNGYYDNHGQRVEGDFAQGVRMILTSQVFTIMSGVATKEQVKDVIRAADHYLYEEKMGGYRLNTDFNEVKLDLGRMFGFAYGQKENGAVFCHMAIMYANALYQRGFIKEGYHVIDSLFRHCNDFSVSRIYPGIPEYIAENGRALYHYLTGSASWLLLTVLTEMFGIKGRYGDLYFEPKLLLEQFRQDGTAKVEFIFAEKSFEVTYQNSKRLEVSEYQVSKIILDGMVYESKDLRCIRRSDILKLSNNQMHLITVVLC
ncbi:GH36-type glycosyl hydrolase domain-containing protein [Lachnoclostridium phytofermentans]|uniref:Cellobiose phosphorylase-like protein n=1 Tax=Lachnoclostridium phytofermentans (strain ATCC 700394 / DSM 18823 / ISDg) TaxID=357809 RepID=A9KLB4_LACP7|nr:cellobiose phosphorylase [Lachnoclostridium phytofermentans]ABX41243.1 Cellobiose phosphorylase-like protein [Lachnoclostridium phytofermentans ISDg]